MRAELARVSDFTGELYDVARLAVGALPPACEPPGKGCLVWDGLKAFRERAEALVPPTAELEAGAASPVP